MAVPRKRTWADYEKEVSAKRRGGQNATGAGKKKAPTPASIMVQRINAVPNRLQKYEPLDT